MEIAKKDIKYIIDYGNDKIEQDEINLCFYNAKFYSDFCNDYNYFYDLERTFDLEYNNYLRLKSNIFKFPDIIGYKKYKSFLDYFDKQLNYKIKNDFGLNINDFKTQSIKENVKISIHKIFTKFNESNYIDVKDILDYDNIISKKISFCQEKLFILTTFKKSNFEEFKNVLLSQIYYVNNNLQNETEKKINLIVDTLDEFFKISIKNEQKDIKEIEDFKNGGNLIVEEFNKNIDNSSIEIRKIIIDYREGLVKFLREKEKNIENYLRTKNYKLILEEIEEKVKSTLKELNDKIQDIINNIDLNCFECYNKANHYIQNFSEQKYKLRNINNFKNYLLSEIGNKEKNINEQIYEEIANSIRSLTKIYHNKGFLDWLKSAFSNYY